MIYVLAFLGSGIVVVLAGTALARYADAIAEATKLGRLWIGSVLLAGAFGQHEVDLDAAQRRHVERPRRRNRETAEGDASEARSLPLVKRDALSHPRSAAISCVVKIDQTRRPRRNWTASGVYNVDEQPTSWPHFPEQRLYAIGHVHDRRSRLVDPIYAMQRDVIVPRYDTFQAHSPSSTSIAR